MATPVVRSTSVAMEMEGLQPLLRAFSTYGKEANAELRKASRTIAEQTVTAARSLGSSVAQQAPLAAASLRVSSDRVPSLLYGGAKRVGKRKTPVGALIYGAEFGGRGSSKTMQFLPHRGRTGYFLFPTLRKRGKEDTLVYLQALDDLGARWAGVK